MASLTYYYRPSRRGEAVPGRLCLRVVHRRRGKSLSTPYRLSREEFDVLSREDGEIPESLGDIRRYMQDTRDTFARIVNSVNIYTCDTEKLIRPLRCRDNHFAEYALSLAEHLESWGHMRTARAYRSTVKRLAGFTGRSVCLSAICKELVESFEAYLREEGLLPNTISFYMRNLRAIYNKAVEEGLIEDKGRPPFKHVFTGFHRTAKRALSLAQMQQVQEMEYSLWLEAGHKPLCSRQLTLYKSWRLFIFCFHARGMCFADLAYLKKENISQGIIHYYRKKTGGLIEVKVTPQMQRIIDSFAGETAGSPYVFPIIVHADRNARLQYESGLSRQNRLLKQLAKEAGIEVALSTHVARHSWASIAKYSDMPLWVISEGLGHSSEKTTYTYLAGLERSRLDVANETVCALVCGGSGGLPATLRSRI